MDKDKELNEFMGDLALNHADPLQNQEQDPFSHLDTKEEVITEVEDEKPLPFNKDPKIQKYIDKEISKRLESFTPEAPQQTQAEEDSFKDVIDSLTTVIGNDTPEKVSALNALKKSLGGLDERATQKAYAKLEEIQNSQLEADRAAEAELETAFDNIEESFGVDISSNSAIAKKTRQEFVSFVEKIAPKRNGEIIDYPDMISAWETFSDLKKSTAQPSRAKELAARSMRTSTETSAEPIMRRGRTPFSNSDEYIESLSGKL